MLDTGHQERVAKAIAKGVCSHLGVKYVPKAEPKPASKPVGNALYKVQVGAFADPKNADKLAEELKRKGYSTYIVREEK